MRSPLPRTYGWPADAHTVSGARRPADADRPMTIGKDDCKKLMQYARSQTWRECSSGTGGNATVRPQPNTIKFFLPVSGVLRGQIDTANPVRYPYLRHAAQKPCATMQLLAAPTTRVDEFDCEVSTKFPRCSTRRGVEIRSQSDTRERNRSTEPQRHVTRNLATSDADSSCESHLRFASSLCFRPSRCCTRCVLR